MWEKRLPIAYEHPNNIDPGATGVPIEISQGWEGCIWKSVANPWDRRVNLLKWRAPLFFLASEPPANSFPPAPNAIDFTPRLTEADVDYVAVPSLTPSFATPGASSVLQGWRWHWNDQDSRRPQADRLTAERQEQSFRRDSAKESITAMLTMGLNIDSTVKKYLIDWTIIHAEDICGSLERGIRFNHPQTDGGVQNGRKPIVCVAALLTGDSRFTHWANRTDWAIEDAYCQYITEEHLIRFGADRGDVIQGFLEEDLGTPWWFPGTAAWNVSGVKTYPIRRLPGLDGFDGWRRSYQESFFAHMTGFHALCGMLPGLQAMWNNQVVFDWIDRMCRTTTYNGYGINAAGLRTGGTNNPTVFHKNMFLEYAPAQAWFWT